MMPQSRRAATAQPFRVQLPQRLQLAPDRTNLKPYLLQRMSSLPAPLALHDVTLTLPGAEGPVPILRGVSLEVQAGEIVAVTGRSGSGKSSLLAVAAGLEPASSGSVRLFGQELAGLGEDGLARARRGRVGIVFQAFHLLPNMTALENVAVALETADLARGKAARLRAADALEHVGLGHRLRHYPSQLSGGEQQRVAVARAAVTGPQLVFADEPTGNLDAIAGNAVRDMLFALARERGAALVLVTHEPALARACDRIIRIEDGRVAAPDAAPAAASTATGTVPA
jgi:putative ABC transport system ATP-binding protein